MKKIKISIRMAVLTILMISILFVSAVVMYAATTRFNIKLLESSIDSIEAVVQNCRDELTHSVLRAEEANGLLSVDNTFIQALKYSGSDTEKVYEYLMKIRDDISAVRTFAGGDQYGYYSSFFVNSQMPISNHIEPYSNKKMISDTINLYSDRGLDNKKWYVDFMQSSNQICIFQDEEIPQCVFYAQKVKNLVDINDEVLGISVVGVDFQNILRNYGGADDKNTAQIMVIGSGGELICTNDENMPSEVIDFAIGYQKRNDVKTGDMTNAEIDGNQYYAGMYDMDFGLTLVAAVSRDDVFITIRQTTRDVYIVVLIVLFAALILTVWLSGIIVRPIKRLSDYMITSGQDESFKYKTSDSIVKEIDSLYKAYDSMTDRISRLLVTARNLGEQKKETEFRMLQTQINPHYLYNALDSISWMALRHGEEEISDMASALADSFRYNARTSEMIIELSGEIEFIRNYIKLQEKFRNTEFILSVDVDEETGKLQVPKFMLQPLVENAIIHGLKRDETLSVYVNAKVHDNVLKIRIEDNGEGFSADSLNRYLNGDNTVFNTDKIGIINIHKRLKNKYGDKAGLSYFANAHGGLTAEIALPLKEGEKEIEIF